MELATDVKKVLKGGEFIIAETTAEHVFVPEDLTEEQLLFGKTVQDFIETRVHPNVEKIDKGDHELVIQLLHEAGELGILGAGIPEAYGGLGLDFNTESIISEKMGMGHSLSVAWAAHVGIGTLPILYYGTEEQKLAYLPKLSTGELKAAYCLTEPGSGSDALGAKTKAVLTEDGKHYVINGQKMWITNGGFADLFTVFAKIDGEKFTGFLVDAKSEGVSLGAEEQKLGIKGSSTRQVFFNNVKVPAENILGEIGKGHKIAFNVLNIGRYKLCAMVLGGAKKAASVAINYANERVQFGKPISGFGAIRYKMAEMAVKIWASEAACYRASGLINDHIHALVEKGMEPQLAKLEAAEEYNIECALLKVLGSETLDYVVDEAVQIYGGMGFSEEAPVARAYRDSRINRIFEGTNEINRLLSVGTLLKKAFKGELDLMTPAFAIQKELLSVPDFGGLEEGLFAAEKQVLHQAKKAFLMVAGSAVQKYMNKLEEEQELLMCAADILMELYTAESAILRAEKLIASGHDNASLFEDLAKTYLSDSLERINLHGKHAIAHFTEGDEQRVMLMGLKRFTKYEAYDSLGARKRIGNKLIADNRYSF